MPITNTLPRTENLSEIQPCLALSASTVGIIHRLYHGAQAVYSGCSLSDFTEISAG
jgi:hypothetical protein